jgi:poly(3-hydroxybutyrate) depolymerase
MRLHFAFGPVLRLWACILIVAGILGCGGYSAKPNSTQPTPAPPAAPTSSDPSVAARNLQFQGAIYPFFVFVPSSCTVIECPAILLAHGAGGNGLDFLEIWKRVADQNGIILLAPTLPLDSSQITANTETKVPQLFPQLVEATKGEWKIDARRVYLFGYSAGGYTIYDAAMLDSTYFAAAGVFAAVITPDYDWIVQKATRKTPIAIYIGGSDQLFSLADARRTRDLLLSNGFTVHYVEIPHQDHNYGAVSGQVNTDVWTFMSQYSLP